jgi:hypothetical protein
MWKVIRECLPAKEKSKPFYEKDHQLLAEEFIIFFASVGKRTADKVKKLAEQNHIPITPSPPYS